MCVTAHLISHMLLSHCYMLFVYPHSIFFVCTLTSVSLPCSILLPLVSHSETVICIICHQRMYDFHVASNSFYIHQSIVVDCTELPLTKHVYQYGWFSVSHMCKKSLQHSYFVLCQCCKRKVHKNCTEFTQDEFQNAKTSGNWFCRLCNESIFAFNHIDDDYEFVFTLCKFMNATCKSYDSDVQMGEKSSTHLR